MPNSCLTNNECSSTPGEDTEVHIEISPYFPVRNYVVSQASNGRSWLGNGSWGNYGHNRSNGARSHAGCDIYTHEGESVYAVKSGTIISNETVTVSSQWGGAGVITIDHGDYIVRYGEVKNIVKTSGIVVQGEKIAEVSNTTYYLIQPMLHLEMYDKSASGSLSNMNSPKMVNGRPVKRRIDLINPTSFLENWVNNLRPAE